MGNMSYCEFENTFQDLEQCYESLTNAGSVKKLEEVKNVHDRPYIKKLINLCKDIVEEFGEEAED